MVFHLALVILLPLNSCLLDFWFKKVEKNLGNSTASYNVRKVWEERKLSPLMHHKR